MSIDSSPRPMWARAQHVVSKPQVREFDAFWVQACVGMGTRWDTRTAAHTKSEPSGRFVIDFCSRCIHQ